MRSFVELLGRGDVVIADGATGTNYHAMGLPSGTAPEQWVLEAPDRVRELHRRFVAAGSELLLTCTFGATAPRLGRGPLAGQVAEINARAAALAREAAGDDALVAGSIGPTGQLVEPYGPLTREVCLATYAEQAAALVEGGVDLLVLETFYALEEAIWALQGVRSVSELPLVVSFSFDQGTRTMMGVGPADVVAAVAGYDVAAIGTNCGRSLEETGAVVEAFARAAPAAALWVKPNAGAPQRVDGAIVYETGPDAFARHTGGFVAHGAKIVGGCCGTTPEHIAAIAAMLRQ